MTTQDNAFCTIIKDPNSNKQVNVHKTQYDDYNAFFCINKDQVVERKSYTTMKNAKKAANKFFD